MWRLSGSNLEDAGDATILDMPECRINYILYSFFAQESIGFLMASRKIRYL